MHVLMGAVIPPTPEDALEPVIDKAMGEKCDYWSVFPSDLNFKKIKEIEWDLKPTKEEVEKLRSVWEIVSGRRKANGEDLGREVDCCPNLYNKIYGHFDGFLAYKMSLRPYGVVTLNYGWIDEDAFSGPNRIDEFVKEFDRIVSECDPDDIFLELDCHV